MRTRKIPPRCGCGCGQHVLIIRLKYEVRFNKYLPGHSHANKGIPKSPEHIAKLILSHTGYRDSPETKARKSLAATGRKQSAEERRKKSKARIGRFRGEKANGWRGGISSLPYSKEWTPWLKQEIRQRDRHHCQNPFCMNLSNILNVHHIDYDKENNNKGNLITLCTRCHSKTSTGNREYWKKYYQAIQCINSGGDETEILKQRIIYRIRNKRLK